MQGVRRRPAPPAGSARSAQADQFPWGASLPRPARPGSPLLTFEGLRRRRAGHFTPTRPCLAAASRRSEMPAAPHRRTPPADPQRRAPIRPPPAARARGRSGPTAAQPAQVTRPDGALQPKRSGQQAIRAIYFDSSRITFRNRASSFGSDVHTTVAPRAAIPLPVRYQAPVAKIRHVDPLRAMIVRVKSRVSDAQNAQHNDVTPD